MIAALGWLWAAYKALNGVALADGQPCPWCGRVGVEDLERRIRALEARKPDERPLVP